MDANDREKLGGGMICDILKKQGHMFILKPASFTIEFSTIWFVVGPKEFGCNTIESCNQSLVLLSHLSDKLSLVN